MTGLMNRPRQRPGLTRWRSCASKTRFRDEHDASKHAKRFSQRVYECSVCGGYHLSSKVER